MLISIFMFLLLVSTSEAFCYSLIYLILNLSAAAQFTFFLVPNLKANVLLIGYLSQTEGLISISSLTVNSTDMKLWPCVILIQQ